MRTAVYSIILFLFMLSPLIPASASKDLADIPLDTPLQEGLELCVKQLNLSKATKTKQLNIALVDMTNPNAPRLAFINPNQMMYAASLPKIAILLGVFDQIFHHRIKLDSATEQIMTTMIRNSNNLSATILLNRVGKQYLADLLQSERYKLYDPDKNGGLWVGKEYARAGAWKRDPLHNISHGATVFQVARFYYMMEKGLLVTPEYSRKMKSIMASPAGWNKFVKGLKAVHPDSVFFRKSGTWKTYYSDSAIIERKGRRYIAVALTHHANGGKWLSDLIVSMDSLIFKTTPVSN